jgi:hypothetical protein
VCLYYLRKFISGQRGKKVCVFINKNMEDSTMFDEAEYRKQYYQENKDKIKERAKRHYDENLELKIQQANEWQKENRERHNEAVARYAANNPEVALSANKRYREKHRHTLDYRIMHMCSKAKSRAKAKGWDFDLDKEYIKSIWPEDNCCPVYGTPFVMAESIIVSWRANNLKSDADLHELEVLVEFYRKLASQ